VTPVSSNRFPRSASAMRVGAGVAGVAVVTVRESFTRRCPAVSSDRPQPVLDDMGGAGEGKLGQAVAPEEPGGVRVVARSRLT
jgi:hypothetical protein